MLLSIESHPKRNLLPREGQQKGVEVEDEKHDEVSGCAVRRKSRCIVCGGGADPPFSDGGMLRVSREMERRKAKPFFIDRLCI